jgi:hypothetical protein
MDVEKARNTEPIEEYLILRNYDRSANSILSWVEAKESEWVGGVKLDYKLVKLSSLANGF